MLADDVIYPYNEYLLVIAEHGLAGWLFLFCLFYEICKNGTMAENKYLMPSLMVFLIFCFFSYPMHIFRLQVLFICIFGTVATAMQRSFLSSVMDYLYSSFTGFCSILSSLSKELFGWNIIVLVYLL